MLYENNFIKKLLGLEAIIITNIEETKRILSHLSRNET